MEKDKSREKKYERLLTYYESGLLWEMLFDSQKGFLYNKTNSQIR